MLDPSKPRPSSKASVLNSRADTVKCCHSPGKSTNRTSTAWTPLSLISDITSAGFIAHSFHLSVPSQRSRRARRGRLSRNVARTSAAEQQNNVLPQLRRLRGERVDEPDRDCVLLLCRVRCVLREVWHTGEIA